jgi:hypothetical protein
METFNVSRKPPFFSKKNKDEIKKIKRVSKLLTKTVIMMI